ncbi:MAG: AAA-like domain-containing protein [Crocosphaera sp.]
MTNTKFFITHKAIEGKELNTCYVPRKEDKSLLSSLSNGQLTYVFNASRMGKTSLLNKVKEELIKQKIRCAYVTLQGGLGESNNTEEQWYDSLIDTIWKELKITKLEIDINQWRDSNNSGTPGYRFQKFLKKIICKSKPKKIVILIDEIDYLLNFYFRDSFMGIIRSVASRQQEFPGLTFCLVGMITPQDLIQNRVGIGSRLNIQSVAIELKGLELGKCQEILAQGLTDVADDPQEVIKQIHHWTDGQPFLTQILCQLVLNKYSKIDKGNEEIKINHLVQTEITDPRVYSGLTYITFIRDKLSQIPELTGILLGLYRKILTEVNIPVKNDGSVENYYQQRLILSGLAIKEGNYIKVFNKIYKAIFDEKWVYEELNKIITLEYREGKAAWEASALKVEDRDKCWLLSGQELENAMEKNYGMFGDLDSEFVRQSVMDIAKKNGKFDDETQWTEKQKNKIIYTIINWTNRHPYIEKKLFKIIKQQGNINYISEDFDVEQWVKNLVEEYLLNDKDIKNEIEEKLLKDPEEERFWLLVTYGKVLHPSYQIKVSDFPLDMRSELDKLCTLGLVRKRYEHLKHFNTYWEVANKVYAEVFNQHYIEEHLPTFRFNSELDSSCSYEKKFGLWLITQEDKHLLSPEELSVILPKLSNQNLYEEEELFLIKSQIKQCTFNTN